MIPQVINTLNGTTDENQCAIRMALTVLLEELLLKYTD